MEEIVQITTDQLIKHIQGVGIGAAIFGVKNTGNIQDPVLRRRWVTAKRAIEKVEHYLQGGNMNGH